MGMEQESDKGGSETLTTTTNQTTNNGHVEDSSRQEEAERVKTEANKAFKGTIRGKLRDTELI